MNEEQLINLNDEQLEDLLEKISEIKEDREMQAKGMMNNYDYEALEQYLKNNHNTLSKYVVSSMESFKMKVVPEPFLKLIISSKNWKEKFDTPMIDDIMHNVFNYSKLVKDVIKNDKPLIMNYIYKGTLNKFRPEAVIETVLDSKIIDFNSSTIMKKIEEDIFNQSFMMYALKKDYLKMSLYETKYFIDKNIMFYSTENIEYLINKNPECLPLKIYNIVDKLANHPYNTSQNKDKGAISVIINSEFNHFSYVLNNCSINMPYIKSMLENIDKTEFKNVDKIYVIADYINTHGNDKQKLEFLSYKENFQTENLQNIFEKACLYIKLNESTNQSKKDIAKKKI